MSFTATGTRSSSLDEVGNSISITVLSRSRSGDVTVSYATSDGTAQSGLDYSETSGSVTVPGGSTTATVGVEILDDVTMKGRRPSR